MISYTYDFNAVGASKKISALPDKVDQAIIATLDRVELEGVREMRREAPKFDTILTNSIHAERPSPMELVIAPGVKYAEYVERGTGPAAGQAPYMPNAENLMAYVKRRSSVNFRNTKQGSAGRGAQLDEIRDRAWALARYIYAHGTKPNPYVERTHAWAERRVPQILVTEINKVADEESRT